MTWLSYWTRPEKWILSWWQQDFWCCFPNSLIDNIKKCKQNKWTVRCIEDPTHQNGLRGNQLEGSFALKVPVVMVDTKLRVSQQHAKVANCLLGCIRQNVASRWRKVILPLCSEKTLTWHSPEQLNLYLDQKGGTRWSPVVPSSLSHSVVLWPAANQHSSHGLHSRLQVIWRTPWKQSVWLQDSQCHLFLSTCLFLLHCIT